MFERAIKLNYTDRVILSSLKFSRKGKTVRDLCDELLVKDKFVVYSCGKLERLGKVSKFAPNNYSSLHYCYSPYLKKLTGGVKMPEKTKEESKTARRQLLAEDVIKFLKGKNVADEEIRKVVARSYSIMQKATKKK